MVRSGVSELQMSLRDVPAWHNTSVHLVCTFKQRTKVQCLHQQRVPYKRTILFSKNWGVPHRTAIFAFVQHFLISSLGLLLLSQYRAVQCTQSTHKGLLPAWWWDAQCPLFKWRGKGQFLFGALQPSWVFMEWHFYWSCSHPLAGFCRAAATSQ